MTLSGLKTTHKELDALKAMLPRLPTIMDKLAEAWLAVLSPGEISRVASILVRLGNGTAPTQAESEFMDRLIERPGTALPLADRRAPSCHVCRAQPATQDGTWSFCKTCHDAMAGEHAHLG